MKDFSAFLHVRIYKNLKSAPESIYLKTCPASFPRAQSASLISALHPELLSWGAEGQQLQ